MRPSLALAILFSTSLISGEVAAAKTNSTTIISNGVTYSASSTSTCSDGTAALRYNRKWWCPVVSTVVAAPTTPTTTTTTPAVPITYTAKLSWTIPTTRSDGTALTASELAGYEVYYTNDSGSVSAMVPISDGSAVSTTVTSLASGNYSFSISAIDAGGLKSALSSVATISFP